MFSSKRAALCLPEFSLFLFTLIPCKRYFVTFCWIVIFWKLILFLRYTNLESLSEKLFSNIFISILSTELSNYDPWNSLHICQFPNSLINKTIVLSNQQLVNFYENNNLGLCGLQIFFKKLDLTWGGYF